MGGQPRASHELLDWGREKPRDLLSFAPLYDTLRVTSSPPKGVGI